ncbi:nucleotide disphospho-sugar-binding domain-containing protein [Streptomyces althioticus]|uniref:nucleotide disphospho-sugar-binding domain-containing protein n=1 Tax=Streptomyces althioticus TaxID=83380 RepID=UPI00367EF858
MQEFDGSHRFVGPSLGARPHDPTFPFERLRDPVLYASLGTVFDADPRLLRCFATALAPLGGTVVLSTGRTDPGALEPLPKNVIARPFVPQTEVLERTALLVTHGGMNSVNEALYAGVPMLVIPQGADQPLVARRVTDLGAGLSMHPRDVLEDSVRSLARRLLDELRFRKAAHTMRDAQHRAGGFRRAADELERYLRTARPLRPAADRAQQGDTMSPAVVALLLLAGLSEAAGRIMPLLVCRPGVSPRNVVGLMLTGAIVEGAVLALWPLTAWTVAELLLTSPPADGTLEWTPGLLAPLLLAAVLAFPLLGPLLHLLLFAGVGATLTGPLAATTPGWAGGPPPAAWPQPE